MSSIKQAIDYAFDGKVSEMSDELNSALLQKVSDMIMGKRQEIAQSLITPTNEAKEEEEEEEDEDESDEEYIKHPNGWRSIRSKRKEDDEEEVKYNPKKKPVSESEMSSAQKARLPAQDDLPASAASREFRMVDIRRAPQRHRSDVGGHRRRHSAPQQPFLQCGSPVRPETGNQSRLGETGHGRPGQDRQADPGSALSVHRGYSHIRGRDRPGSRRNGNAGAAATSSGWCAAGHSSPSACRTSSPCP